MKRISSGGAYEEKIGYSRAVVAGGMVYVSGCVGEGADVKAQCAAALATIERALAEAGSDFAHVVRCCARPLATPACGDDDRMRAD